MSDTVQLAEYRDSVVKLAHQDAVYIESALHDRISVRRPVTGSHYVLNPAQYVGVVQLPSGRRLESRPKVPVANLFYMLAIAADVPLPFLHELTGFDRFDDILEFVAEHLVDLVDSRIAGGLYRSYIDEEENLGTIRGKIVISEDVRRNSITRHLTYCRYSDFTWDIPENQVIRQTIHLLSHWGFSRQLRARLWQLDGRLSDVRPVTLPLSVFRNFTYHRLNADYEPIHNLCWLFLSGASLSELAGDTRFPSFLIDMNDLFERFVTRILSGQLSPDISISSQVRRHLDGARKIAMRLDLEFHSLGRTIAVGDCKYKRASSKDGNVGDVYQVLAYATARGVGTGLLIYPMHETSVDDELQVLNTDISIFRMPINLGVDARFVMDECNRFAQRVKTVLVQETSKSVSQLAASRAPLLHARA